MNIKDVERIIDKAINKAIWSYVLFIAALAAMDFYYQQELPTLFIMSICISFPLAISTFLFKSTLLDLFKAFEAEKNKEKAG